MQFIDKIILGGLMKRDLREMFGNELILNSPPIPQFMVYLLMTPMFSIFTLAIKFDYLFFTIFQSFHLSVGFIFEELAPFPLNICFKRCFKSLFSPLQRIKQAPKC